MLAPRRWAARVYLQNPGGNRLKHFCLNLLDRRQIKVAVFIHGRHGGHENIRLLGSDTGRHLVQMEGHIADSTPSVIGAGLRIIKEAVDEKSILIGGIGAEGVVFRGDAQPDSHITDSVRNGVQRAVQLKRLADIGAADDGIAAADEGESFRDGFLFFADKVPEAS